jgi:hypothetical protein
LANVAVSEAVGVITLGVRVSPRAHAENPLKDPFRGFLFLHHPCCPGSGTSSVNEANDAEI